MESKVGIILMNRSEQGADVRITKRERLELANPLWIVKLFRTLESGKRLGWQLGWAAKKSAS